MPEKSLAFPKWNNRLYNVGAKGKETNSPYWRTADVSGLANNKKRNKSKEKYKKKPFHYTAPSSKTTSINVDDKDKNNNEAKKNVKVTKKKKWNFLLRWFTCTDICKQTVKALLKQEIAHDARVTYKLTI